MRRPELDAVLGDINRIILGKELPVRLALACLLARGHLLIEDLPGVGKTTLAHVLARVLGLDFQRIQFTSDMLPADILGVSIFDRDSGAFHFHPGPIFARVVLADEINRATPKAQSALLEAMEERQVTAEGATRPLPEPFFVIATQNPANQIGTFPLPESQFDRFLLKIRIGYPSAEEEAALTRHVTSRSSGADLSVEAVQTVIQPATLLALQQATAHVAVDDRVTQYAVAVVRATRESPNIACGAGPRGSIALVRVARALALMAGRGFTTPDDVKAAALPALRHRIAPSAEAEIEGLGADDLLLALLAQVAAPRT